MDDVQELIGNEIKKVKEAIEYKQMFGIASVVEFGHLEFLHKLLETLKKV